MTSRYSCSRPPRLSTARDTRPGTPRPRGRGGQLTAAAVTVAALVFPATPVEDDQAAPVDSSPRRAPQTPDGAVQDVPPGSRDRQVVPAQVGTIRPVGEDARSSSPTGTDVWDRLAACEANGEWDYGPQSGWGSGLFEGGLQFHPATWDAFRPAGYPDAAYLASREEQIAVAERVLAAQGWGAWPACSRRLGLRP